MALSAAFGSSICFVCLLCMCFAFSDSTEARRHKWWGTRGQAVLAQESKYERRKHEDNVPSGPFAPLRPWDGPPEQSEPLMGLTFKSLGPGAKR